MIPDVSYSESALEELEGILVGVILFATVIAGASFLVIHNAYTQAGSYSVRAGESKGSVLSRAGHGRAGLSAAQVLHTHVVSPSSIVHLPSYCDQEISGDCNGTEPLLSLPLATNYPSRLLFTEDSGTKSFSQPAHSKSLASSDRAETFTPQAAEPPSATRFFEELPVTLFVEFSEDFELPVRTSTLSPSEPPTSQSTLIHLLRTLPFDIQYTFPVVTPDVLYTPTLVLPGHEPTPTSPISAATSLPTSISPEMNTFEALPSVIHNIWTSAQATFVANPMIAHLLTQIRSDPLIPEYRSALLLGFGVFFVLYTLYRLYFCVPIQITHTPRTTAIESVDSVSGKIQKVEYADLLKERCPQLTDPKQSVFKPTPWLLNGDAQTIWTVVHTFNNHMRVKYERELVYFKDGGHVALDWCPGPSTSRDRSTPTIVILHGLTGGSHESYIQDLVEMLVAPEHRTDRSTLPDGWPGMGYRVVVMNARGCANSRLTSPRLFNGANTEDVGAVVEYVRRRIPDAPLLGIGYSLGANIITKYVGEMKDDCPFVACVGVGSPYDLYVGNLALHRTWFGRTVYSTRIGQNLVNLFKTHIDQMATRPELDVAAIIGSKTVTEFDANATAKAFGFRHVNEYYRNGCSSAVIPDIAIPTLFLSSHDDPIASSDAIPYHETMANPNVVLAVTRMGGHLGWFQGWFSPRRWYQRPVAEFIQCMIENHVQVQNMKKKLGILSVAADVAGGQQRPSSEQTAAEVERPRHDAAAETGASPPRGPMMRLLFGKGEVEGEDSKNGTASSPQVAQSVAPAASAAPPTTQVVAVTEKRERRQWDVVIARVLARSVILRLVLAMVVGYWMGDAKRMLRASKRLR